MQLNCLSCLFRPINSNFCPIFFPPRHNRLIAHLHSFEFFIRASSRFGWFAISFYFLNILRVLFWGHGQIVDTRTIHHHRRYISSLFFRHLFPFPFVSGPSSIASSFENGWEPGRACNIIAHFFFGWKMSHWSTTNVNGKSPWINRNFRSCSAAVSR